ACRFQAGARWRPGRGGGIKCARGEPVRPGEVPMRWTIAAAILPLILLGGSTVWGQPGEMPWVQVSKDKKGFVLDPPGRPFVPWGFNYDHDEKGRLIEDYWKDEWPTVEAHSAGPGRSQMR